MTAKTRLNLRHALICSAILVAGGTPFLSAQDDTSVQKLDPILVTEKSSVASRFSTDPLETPFSVSVVTRREMDQVGASSLEDAMRSVAGLQHATQGNYYTRFETRGLRDTQDVLVLLDEVPFRILQGNADVTLIPTDLIERIEFLKGPASSVYGRGAIGGVVQISTIPADEAEKGGSAKLSLGSFGRIEGSAKYSLRSASSRLGVGVGANHSDGFQAGTERDQHYANVSASKMSWNALKTTFGYFHSRVKAGRGSIIPLENGRPMYGITRGDNFGIPDVYIEGKFHAISLKNDFSRSNQWTLTAINTFTWYDRLFMGGITIVPGPNASNKGYSETDTADRASNNELILQRCDTFGPWKNVFRVGTSLELGWQKQKSPSFSGAPTYRGPNYNEPVSNVKNDPRGIRGTTVASDFDQTILGSYVQNRLSWEGFGITTGFRYDDFDQSLERSNTSSISAQRKSRVSPRVAIDWTFLQRQGQRLAWFACYDRGIKPTAPALNTLNGVTVAQLLKPEQTRSWETGLKGDLFGGHLFFQASYFDMLRTDGQRSFRVDTDSFLFTNARYGTKGIEGELRARINQYSSFFATYAWHDARHKDFVTTPGVNFAGYRIRMSATHLYGAGHTFTWGRWAWVLSVNYVGKRPLRDNVVNPQILPSYTLVSSSLNFDLNKSWRLQAGVSNLGDKYYIADDFSSQNAGCAGAPRSFFGSAKYSF